MKSVFRLSISFITFLTSCVPSIKPITSVPTIQSTVSPFFTSEFRPSVTPEIIPSLPPITPTLQVATETFLPIPTTTIGEMQMLFPTFIPAEGAEYRPPLYPVPWALMPFDHFYFASPIAATYPGDPIWDYRYGGIYFGPDVIHTGIDLPAPRGAEVLAAGSGTVIWAGIGLYSGSRYDLKDPYGLAVAIRHDFGYKDQPLYTIYAHLDEVGVIIGQKLKTGETLGKVGDTGNTTGPHLHFEVRVGENDFFQTRNPELWISPPQGYGLIVGRVLSTSGNRLDSHEITLKSLDNERIYSVKTYAPLTVNSDAYFDENVVLGDLPTGVYELNTPYLGWNNRIKIQILPGQITHFSFQGFYGYNFSPPPPPEIDFP
jgi:murein DD-endopeptidase MepM/ murein hydrolase activator NlpD